MHKKQKLTYLETISGINRVYIETNDNSVFESYGLKIINWKNIKKEM